MRKNIFLKSMLRQPLRTGLLVFLIGLATFAFFLRTAEFLTVRDQVGILGGLQRPIGFLQHDDYWGDVSAAAEILAQSPAVGFIDSRVGIEGLLVDMLSPDIAGMMPWVPREERPRITEAIFTATVNHIQIINEQNSTRVFMNLTVHEVLTGFPEHAAPRRNVYIMHTIPYGEDSSFLEVINHAVIADSLHLFRAAHYISFLPGEGTQIPSVGTITFMSAIPLYEGGPYIKTLSAPDLNMVEHYDYYEGYVLRPMVNLTQIIEFDQFFRTSDWEIPEGFWEWTAGFLGPDGAVSDYIPQQVLDDIPALDRHLRTVYLITTRDMSAMPAMQRGATFRMQIGNPAGQFLYMINRGRMLTHEDYLYANPVAVINSQFAAFRGVSVGDTLEIKVPLNQEIVGLTPAHWEFIVRGVGDAYYYTLELEIVGTYLDFWATGPHVPGIVTSAFIYIPHSLLPEGLSIAPPAPDAIPGWDTPSHIPSIWYGFTLLDSRAEQAFILEYGPLFREMGINLVMFEARSADFWAVIDPMVLLVTFNAIVFWIVLVLVMALVVFLFLTQRRKDIAIQQALGFTPLKVILRLIASLLVFGLPAILIGGLIGWNIAVETTTYTLEPIGEFIHGFVPNVQFTWTWFVAMGLVVLGLALVMLLSGAIYMVSFPVLNQLQGVYSKPKKKKKAAVVSGEVTAVPTMFFIPEKKLATSTGRVISGWFRWVLRQVRRAPVKSGLGVAVALFFILVMGWLSESIVRSEENVEELLRYTVIRGEVELPPFFISHDGHAARVGLERFRALDVIAGGYLNDFVMAGGHGRSFIIPAQPGGFPENWHDYIGFDRGQPVVANVNTFDSLYAFNNFDMFMEDNYLEDFGGLQINFLPGYDRNNFVFTEGELIPIIVPESLLERRGVDLGDIVHIGLTTDSPMDMQSAYAQIIGIHDMFVSPSTASEATFIPLYALEHLLGFVIRYNVFNFTVDPVHNRNLTHVREFITGNIGRLSIQMWDEELNNMIGIANQTLLLLELIYPLALIASIVIAGGLSMLLMLQNAKSAAILHVIGTSKKKTMLMLLMEQFLVCLGGVLPGLLMLLAMRVSFDSALFMAVGLYLAGVAAGAIMGAVMVIRRPPLVLLQVKE